MGIKDTIKEDINSLEEKLQILEGAIPDKEFKEISTQVEEIRKAGIDLPDDGFLGEAIELKFKILKLEFGKLSDRKIKEISKDININRFLDKIEYIKVCISEKKDVKEIIDCAYTYWKSIKTCFDEIEADDIERKLAEITLDNILMQINTTNEVNLEAINNIDYYLIRDKLQRILERKDIDLQTHLLASSWFGESVDMETGEINEKAMEKLIKEERLWEVLAKTNEY